MSGAMLADLLAVTRQAVSQYERGQLTPCPLTMNRICLSLRLPRSYFLQQSVEKVGTLFFRSFASATKTERQKQFHRQKWRRRIVDFLRRYLTFPEVRIPQMYDGDPLKLTNDEVEQFADESRKHFRLGQGPISDISMLLGNHGAIVVRTSFDARTLDAFSEWSCDDATPYFVLNADKRSAVRSRFDLAHELAHMVLHRHLASASHPRVAKEIEAQANRFAGAFLVPQAAFVESFSAQSIDDFVALKQRWKVSIAALLRRAFETGLIRHSLYRRMITQVGARGWRTREPLDDRITCEKPTLLRRSVELLISNKIADARSFERIGAGSLHDVAISIGVPLESLLQSAIPPSRANAQRPHSRRGNSERVFRLSDYRRDP